jgi:hypothetical protein
MIDTITAKQRWLSALWPFVRAPGAWAVICVFEVSRFHRVAGVLGITLLVAVGWVGAAFRQGASRLSTLK